MGIEVRVNSKSKKKKPELFDVFRLQKYENLVVTKS